MKKKKHFILLMSIEVVAKGSNYTAINIGKLNELEKHVFKLRDGKSTYNGKVFIGKAAHMTGCEISYTVLNSGVSEPFFHLHHQHEEEYLIISGSGQYQVDDSVFDISEGSVIRVGIGANHCMKNTGNAPLIYICVQTTENSYKDNIPNECEFTKTEPKFH